MHPRRSEILPELFPWSELDQATRRKPQALQQKDKEKSVQQAGATMLDHFVSKSAQQDSQDAADDAGEPSDMNFVMNEDGTMSMVPAQAAPS